MLCLCVHKCVCVCVCEIVREQMTGQHNVFRLIQVSYQLTKHIVFECSARNGFFLSFYFYQPDHYCGCQWQRTHSTHVLLISPWLCKKKIYCVASASVNVLFSFSSGSHILLLALLYTVIDLTLFYLFIFTMVFCYFLIYTEFLSCI